MSISLVMIVKNEEMNLPSCLQNAKEFVDEMIVVDTGSTDRTREIAQSFGAEVFEFAWSGDFSAARNFGLAQAKCEWILVLDADEVITSFDRNEIREFTLAKQSVGKIRIESKFFDGDDVRELHTFGSRFFPRGYRFEGRIHEQLQCDLPRQIVPIIVSHSGYFHRVNKKSERNIPLLLQELQADPKNAYFHFQLSKEYNNSNEYHEAEKHADQAFCFASGREGYYPQLVVHLLYLTIKNKQFERGLEILNSVRDRLANYADFHFVSGIFYMELILFDLEKYVDKFPLVEQSYLRCLQIGENQQLDGVKGTGSFLATYNLGTFYESLGDMQKSLAYYKAAAQMGYEPASVRYKMLSSIH